MAVAHDLTPSEAAQLDPAMVLGFATEAGGQASHTAIVAAALEIPAVVGLGPILDRRDRPVWPIIDGDEGLVILDPDPPTLNRYRAAAVDRSARFHVLSEQAGLPAETLDGAKVELFGNIEFVDEVAACLKWGAAGVGLVPDRVPLPSRRDAPHRGGAVPGLFGRDPLARRQADRDPDPRPRGRQADLVPGAGSAEANPVLGLRSLRLSLRHPELFRTQLRAMLRAAVQGDVRILFPLVSTLDELRRARAMLGEVAAELRAEGRPLRDALPLGIMVEVPAAALMADQFAKEVDFFSIGTNDLIQYTLAVDRTNETVADLYSAADPSVLRLIAMVVEAAEKRGIEVSVCGSMGGEPLYTMFLLGLGLRSLSMPPHQLPEIRRVIRGARLDAARALAAEALRLDSAREVVALLRSRAAADPGSGPGEDGESHDPSLSTAGVKPRRRTRPTGRPYNRRPQGSPRPPSEAAAPNTHDKPKHSEPTPPTTPSRDQTAQPGRPPTIAADRPPARPTSARRRPSWSDFNRTTMTKATKVRLRFAKRGDLRLASHHDVMRCLERMVRRGAIPVASSQGFSPRPKIVFALAMGLGIEGRREVVDFELTEPMEPAELLRPAGGGVVPRLHMARRRGAGRQGVRPQARVGRVRPADPGGPSPGRGGRRGDSHGQLVPRGDEAAAGPRPRRRLRPAAVPDRRPNDRRRSLPRPPEGNPGRLGPPRRSPRQPWDSRPARRRRRARPNPCGAGHLTAFRRRTTAASQSTGAVSKQPTATAINSGNNRMKKEMLINVLQPEECRIAIIENGVLEELYVERTSHESYTGNIYKGKIVNLEPAIQAAFVDFSVGRNGFLHVSDVEPQYYDRHQAGDDEADSGPGPGPKPREPRRDRDRDRPDRRPKADPNAADFGPSPFPPR